jgi:hypothetical protein
MTMRSRRETITFKHPFRIKGIDRLLPAGAYEVITDEEMIEGLSFASFRRVAMNTRYWPEATGPSDQVVHAFSAFDDPAMATQMVEPDAHRYHGGPKSND